MSRPWFRMYSEFAADPKVQLLAFDDQRHYIMLLCLKCNGTLDSQATPEFMDRMVSKALGLDILSAAEAKRRLCEVGLITDRWQPVKWDDRQYDHDVSTDRVRRFRERNAPETLQKRNETVSGTGESRAEQSQRDAEIDSASPAKPSSKEKQKRPSRRCPSSFAVTDELRAWAVAERPDVDVDRETASFRDYEFRNPHSDWVGTWRNWIRNAKVTKAVAKSRGMPSLN